MQHHPHSEHFEASTEQLLYGRHPIMEALEQGKGFDKIFIQRGIDYAFRQRVEQLAVEQDITVQIVPAEKMNRLTRKNHQGVAGFLSLISYYSLSDVLSLAYEQGEIPLLLICDGITDVGNFGAMARSAACAGVHGIVIAAKGAVSINAEALKASAGALHQIPVCKVRFIDRALLYLQENGVQIAATSLEGSLYVQDAPLAVPTAIIMGAEGKGVSPTFLKMADVRLKIPMLGNFDSFNVSVATGIILYETMRQRMQA